ncbi:nucleotidyltransferase domain-containing protein [Halobacillus sp. A5]|uniref:nucleotidyltransferase domain-containing protein n=1 Tax=Halobacillus sp. A5 TaxID=2880263 RepID=UPI0020A68D6C|nr:nucleotidyltransferase domain-containing protein [Halobacillus sp. A5]MCP3028673.1 nucleotidyltransferase domain-containing protein [Halobacillus sp. A5]
MDLALYGKNVSTKVITRLVVQLNEELPLPYFFGILHFEQIHNEKLCEHINREGKLIYERMPAS